MSRDVGHAAGGQTYRPPAEPCQCGHLEAVHNIGTRQGARVRTGCSHGGCGCRLYRPAVVAPTATAGPARLDLDAILGRARALDAAMTSVAATASVRLRLALASAADVPALVDALLDMHGRYWPVDAAPAAVAGEDQPS